MTEHRWVGRLAKAFGKRPVVLRDVLPGPIVTPEQVFAALLSAAEGTRLRRPGPLLRLYAAGAPLARIAPELYPVPGDGTVEGYVARLGRVHPEAGLLVNDAQAGSVEVFHAIGEVLATIHERLGRPWTGVLLDLFAGDYKQSFFGVHKDNQDVVTFTISGHKRFLAWPFEALASRFGVSERRRLVDQKLPSADLAALRADALVLECGPRDVLYWPADVWHVAEWSGSVPVTFSLGLFRGGHPLRALASSLQRLVERGAFTGADVLPAGTTPERLVREVVRAASKGVGREVADLVQLDLTARQSRLGFEHAPPPRSPEDAPLTRADRVRVALRDSFLVDAGDASALRVFAAGHLLAFPRHSRAEAMLRLLRRGGEHDVEALVRRFGRGQETDEAPLEADVVVALVRLLHRHHVLVRVAASPRSAAGTSAARRRSSR